MSLRKDAKVGDMVHIYHMFGTVGEYEHEGEITDIYDGELYGTWGDEPLHFDDDWEVIDNV